MSRLHGALHHFYFRSQFPGVLASEQAPTAVTSASSSCGSCKGSDHGSGESI